LSVKRIRTANAQLSANFDEVQTDQADACAKGRKARKPQAALTQAELLPIAGPAM
jgi:hypothetical protein